MPVAGCNGVGDGGRRGRDGGLAICGGGGKHPLSKLVNMQIRQLKFMPCCSQTRKVHPG